MRIAVDINGMVSLTTGAAHYIRSLLRTLSGIDKENEYFLYACFWKDFEAKLKALDVPKAPNFRVIAMKLPESAVEWAETETGLRIQEGFLEKHGIDVYHGTSNVLPRMKRIKSVLTVQHVLGHFGKLTAWERYYFHRLIPDSIRRAGLFITPSVTTKDDLSKEYGIDPGRISPIYYGEADKVFRVTSEDPDGVAARYGLPEKYILFVGPLNLRKNLPRLIEAFAALKKKGLEHKLVVAGVFRDQYFESIKEQCAGLGIGSEVVFTGLIKKEELVVFYNRASAFVYASLFEGGGCPPLEAMSCGCPVVSSNMSAIAEIVGDAGVLFDPYDPQKIAAAIKSVLSDAALRESLVKKGLKRALDFSWDKTTRDTLDVYKKCFALKP